MKFLKENSSNIIRLLLNQFALAVFGVVLVSASLMANDGSFGVLALCASIFSILFYMYILYATMQELGAKHRIKVEGNRLVGDKHRGLKMMLWAQVPNFVFLLLMLLGFFLDLVFKVTNGGLYTVAFAILYFLQSMYDGLIGFFISDIQTTGQALIHFFCYLGSTIPGILVCWGSYILGTKDKKLFSFLTRKKDDAPPPES